MTISLLRRVAVLAAALAIAATGCASGATAPSAGSSGDASAAPTLPGSSPISSAAIGASEDPAASTDPAGPDVTLPPLDAATPVPSGMAAPAASRVVVRDLGIDLPVVSGDLFVPGNPPDYPLCDVAAYRTDYVQPSLAGSTYISAHARDGMFLPLLKASEADAGKALLGKPVDVYTADGHVFHYTITEVKPHAVDFQIADPEHLAPGEHRLVLQTSEGPYGTVHKLQVAARLVGQGTASTAEANPTPKPRVCAPPQASAEPAASGATGAVATRVVIARYGIDLPVVSGDLSVPGQAPDFPLCDVAQYRTDYVQPSQAGSTYISAHARKGMFLPLLEESQRNDGAALVGVRVDVYTSDARVYHYVLFEVKRHAVDFQLADADHFPAGEHRLVLQTSEGPHGTIPKLQMAAHLVGSESVAASVARPAPHPRACS